MTPHPPLISRCYYKMSDQRQHSKCSPTQLYSDPNNSSFSLSHHALCRDTTGIPPSKTFLSPPPSPLPVKCPSFYVQLELYLCGVLTRRPERVRFTVISSISVHLVSEASAVCIVGFTCMLWWVGGADWSLGFYSSDFREGSVILTCLSGFRCTRFLLSTFPSTFTTYDLYPWLCVTVPFFYSCPLTNVSGFTRTVSPGFSSFRSLAHLL